MVELLEFTFTLSVESSKVYRVGLKGLQGFEISCYSAARGEKSVPSACLSFSERLTKIFSTTLEKGNRETAQEKDVNSPILSNCSTNRADTNIKMDLIEKH